MNDMVGPNWYADIGATAYMTSNAGNLSSLVPFIGKDNIYIGDGSCLPSSHMLLPLTFNTISN